ncbi:TetR/AcrR family transcriptional regulator [Leifsonia sp. NPDC058194]|uniref:TetR/AcrR family transcriptional regulator n=1 Tax=Leifsonia sp. NPDC058194 TaxID=3346374 RepID=UPI0036DE398E
MADSPDAASAPRATADARRPRRHDPARRDRIVDACLDVIAEYGVAGTTHRRVAEAADVSLGSMTYHFTGMDALLAEAFDRFAHTFSTAFEASMADCGSAAEAREALARHILLEVFDTPRELVLTQELYTLAARDPRYRTITNGWMGRSRAVLERFFDPVTAGILDALVEGMTLHRALDIEPYDASAVRAAIDRVAGSTS